MEFDQQFFSAVDSDPADVVTKLCKYVAEVIRNKPTTTIVTAHYDEMLEIYAMVLSILSAHKLHLPTDPPELSGDTMQDVSAIFAFLDVTRTTFQATVAQNKIEQLKSRFTAGFSAAFAYEFSQGDLEKIQSLVNELREQIAASPLLEEDHKHRLLKRLEKLQSEFHKRISDLDRFWGLVGEAGVVLAKLGNDAKPIVDRVREIADIVWRTQSRAEELPSNVPRPLLSNDGENK
jgi:hypothetical protein